jgi:hypothetical protein
MQKDQIEPIVRAIVRQSLAEMLGLNTSPQDQPRRQWYRSSDAAQHLDLDTPDALHDLRLAGDLIEGRHWRDISSRNAKRPTYQYHLGNCRAFLESRRS